MYTNVTRQSMNLDYVVCLHQHPHLTNVDMSGAYRQYHTHHGVMNIITIVSTIVSTIVIDNKGDVVHLLNNI